MNASNDNGNSRDLNGSAGVQKVRTLIEGFDEISHGGLPVGRTTLVSGTSGTGKTLLAVQFLYNGITELDEAGIFVTFEESPSDIITNALSFGWDLQELIDRGKLFILDASPDPEGQEVVGSFDLSALIERIQYAIRKYKAKRVSIDSVTAVFQQYDGASVIRREIFRLAARLKQIGVTSVMTTERVEEYGAVARFGVEEFVSDNVVIVRNVLDDLPIERAMASGKTDLDGAVAKAIELTRDFAPGSTTLIVVTDGDTPSPPIISALPEALDRALVLGIGDTKVGLPIDGQLSRQDTVVLNDLAADLDGTYLDVTREHVPSTAIAHLLSAPSAPASAGWTLQRIAYTLFIALAALYALLPVAQEYFGSNWRRRGRFHPGAQHA